MRVRFARERQENSFFREGIFQTTTIVSKKQLHSEIISPPFSLEETRSLTNILKFVDLQSCFSGRVCQRGEQ